MDLRIQVHWRIEGGFKISWDDWVWEGSKIFYDDGVVVEAGGDMVVQYVDVSGTQVWEFVVKISPVSMSKESIQIKSTCVI